MPEINSMLKKIEEMFSYIDISPQDKEKFIDRYFKYAKDPVISVAVSIVEGQKEQLKLLEDFLNVLPQEVVTHIHSKSRNFISLIPEKMDTLCVYPNLIVSDVTTDNLLDVSVMEAGRTFKEFIQGYEKDMSGEIPGADEKWKTPERIQKRLSTFNERATSQVFTDLLGDKYKPDQIRDWAVKFETARKPMELIFADKPEDFLQMYSANGVHSCMVHQASTWNFMDKVGQTATSFYAHFPYTRGAYLMKNGKVVARVILFTREDQDPTDMGYPNYNKDKTNEWFYGYPYSANAEAGNELKKALKMKGFKPMGEGHGSKGNHFTPPTNVPFIVPGIQINSKEWGMPFPYFDNMDYRGTGFSATFDPDTKQFTLTYKAGKGSVPANNRNGYLCSSDYIQKTCDHCGAHTESNSGWTTTQDGHLYCGHTCAKLNKYSMVHQGNGPIWIKVESEDNFVKSVSGMLFTNLVAAFQNNYQLPSFEGLVLGEDHLPVVERRYYNWQDNSGLYYASEGKMEISKFPVIPVYEWRSQKVVTLDPDAGLEVAA